MAGRRLEFTLSHDTTKITTDCLTTTDKKRFKPTKKDILPQKSHKMVGGYFCDIFKSHICQVGDLQTVKWLYCWGSPTGEFWAPCQAPQPRGLALEGGAPGALGFEIGKAWVQKLHRTEGNRDSTLRGLTQAFTLGPRAKQWPYRSLSQTYLWVF